MLHHCYNQNDTDYHNYIDFPFENVQTHRVYLSNKKKRLLFFDTETTGLPANWGASYKDTKNWPRLVQIAWISSDEWGNIFSRNSFIVKPNNFVIPKEASDIHGITTAKALINGEDIGNVLKLFDEELAEADYIVGHNIGFDINIVACELFRLNIDTKIFTKKQICTMESTINYCAISGPYGYKWPKLSELHYRIFSSNFTKDM